MSERIWIDALAKVRGEGACRVCGLPEGDPLVIAVEVAHTIGRKHDRPVHDYLPTGICSACGIPINAAEAIYGCEKRPGSPLFVLGVSVIPLCRRVSGGCHVRFDTGRLDVLPYLTHAEQAYAVGMIGIERALARLAPSRRREVLP